MVHIVHQISQLLGYEQWDDSRKRRLTAKEEIIGRKKPRFSWRGWMHLLAAGYDLLWSSSHNEAF